MIISRNALLGVLAAILSFGSGCAVPVEADVSPVETTIQSAQSTHVVELVDFIVVDGWDGDEFSGIVPCVRLVDEAYEDLLNSGTQDMYFSFRYTSNGDVIESVAKVPVLGLDYVGQDPNMDDRVLLEANIEVDHAIDAGSVEFLRVELIDAPIS